MYAKTTLKLKIPTSPESDGEIYLTPNTSAVDDERNTDSGIDENHVAQREPFARFANGNHIDKMQSLTSINNGNHVRANEDPVDFGFDERLLHSMDQNNCNGGMYRINSLSNLSQYEREFGSRPKSLIKLREEFDRRRIAMLEQSSPSKQSDDGQSDRLFARSRPNPIQRTLKKRFGIGDTKYIGTDNDTPEQKQYHLTKIKSLGTIHDSEGSECIKLDPFLTPMIPRRHPASLHSFEEEQRNSDSSDELEQQQFERDNDGGMFERGYRRSYNNRHDDRYTESAIPLRQSDGYFRVPKVPPIRQKHQSSSDQQRNRTSSHSLPSDGKLDIVRYGLTHTYTHIHKFRIVRHSYRIFRILLEI